MNKYLKISIIVFCLTLAPCGVVHASTTNGTIDSTYKYAVFMNEVFGTINFGATNGNVSITDSAITGNAWGNNVGWINLNPSRSGVTNNAEGTLSGYAWGEKIGWVNFRPTNGGVSINSSGQFTGHAWNDVAGWIKFDCAQSSTCVTTDWRPASTRSNNSGGGGGGGGGNSDGDTPPGPPENPVLPPGDPIIPPIPDDVPVVIPDPIIDPIIPGDIPPNPDIVPSVTPDVGGGGWNRGFTESPIGVGLGRINQTLQDVIINPVGRKVTEAVTTLGIVTTGAGLAGSILLNPGAASEIVFLPIRIWGLLMSMLGLRKKYKPWGVVYDSITKQPLDPAYVMLMDEKGNEINTAITDINGRYGFLVNPGTYTLAANKTNYIFPSVKLLGKSSDELYPNLYFSGPINVTSDNLVIDRNIPMDPQNFDWNEFQKTKQGKFMNFYSKYDRIIAKFNTAFFFVGFTVATVAYVYASAPYNLVVLGFYIVVLVLKIFGLTPKTHGAIIEKTTGKTLSFAIIHVFSTIFNNEISTKVADAYGRYYCILPKGSYILRVDRKNEDGSYSQVYESGAIEVKSGIINNNIKI